MDKEKQKRINRNNRKRGGNFEKKVADFLGFEVVPYSGSNARFGYGDVRSDIWLIECKNITPKNNKITLKMEWFEKNHGRAYDVGKRSALAWMPAGKPDKFVVMEYDDYAPFGGIYDNTMVFINIEPKVHNTKNLILNLDAVYIQDVRDGRVVCLEFNDKCYYMVSIQKFKEMIL